MSISILVINYNEKLLTTTCINSIFNQKKRLNQLSVFVIENGSKENEQTKGDWFETIVLNQNYGFPFAVNLGVKMAKSDWVLVLNNDCELQENFIEEMIKATEKNPEGKVFSPKIFQKVDRQRSLDSRRSLPRTELRGGNDSEREERTENTNANSNIIYACGDDIDNKGLARNIGRGEIDHGQYDNAKTVPLATFACILIKKEILKKFPLDESYFGYYEDVDFCLRLQKAKTPIFFASKAICFHLGEASFSKLNNLDNEIRQFRNLSFTVIANFPFSNIVRHYLLFNLKTFRYYFFMKKQFSYLLVERQILKEVLRKVFGKNTKLIIFAIFLLDWAAFHDILKGQEDTFLEWLSIAISLAFFLLV